MKRTTFVGAGFILAGIIGFAIARKSSPPAPAPDSAVQPGRDQTAQSAEPVPTETVSATRLVRRTAPPATPSGGGTVTEPVPAASAAPMPAKPPVSLVFNQAVETLTAPQAGSAQRAAAWQQLKDAGQLDQAITEFEQRAVANPEAPEYPAALGQAYLQKAGAIQDIREQGILGMKADQTFDAALKLDPSNWEARYWKATAMSYWPVALGKGNEVVEQFAALITQQEAQAPQPHFAQTYAQLGDYYEKLGHAEYAQQTWQRGVALFPGDQTLQGRIAGVQPAPSASVHR
jgi:cytochrome c-type biogenesis protein CcmH/NrfG